MKFRRSAPVVGVAAVALLSVLLLDSRAAEDPRPGDTVVALGPGGWIVAVGGTVMADVFDPRLEAEAARFGSGLVDMAIAPDGGWVVVGARDYARNGTHRSFNRELQALQRNGERIRAVALGGQNAYAIAYDGGYSAEGIPPAMEDRLSRVAGSVTAMSIGAGGWSIVTRNDHWSTTSASTTPTYRDAVDDALGGGGVSDVALGEAGWIIARADGGFVARGVPSEACTALSELGEGFACIDAADAADLAEKVDPDPLNEGTREAIARNAPRIDPSRGGEEPVSRMRVVLDIDRVKMGTSSMVTELSDAEVYAWKYTCIGRLGDPSEPIVAARDEWGPTDVDVDNFFSLGSFGREEVTLDPQEVHAILLVIGEKDPATSGAQRQRALDRIHTEFSDRCNTALERNLRVADDQRAAETLDRMGRIFMQGLEGEAERIFDRQTNALTDEDEFLGAYATWYINADPSAAGGDIADFVPENGDIGRWWCGAVTPSSTLPIMTNYPCMEVDGTVRVTNP